MQPYHAAPGLSLQGFAGELWPIVHHQRLGGPWVSLSRSSTRTTRCLHERVHDGQGPNSPSTLEAVLDPVHRPTPVRSDKRRQRDRPSGATAPPLAPPRQLEPLPNVDPIHSLVIIALNVSRTSAVSRGICSEFGSCTTRNPAGQAERVGLGAGPQRSAHRCLPVDSPHYRSRFIGVTHS